MQSGHFPFADLAIIFHCYLDKGHKSSHGQQTLHSLGTSLLLWTGSRAATLFPSVSGKLHCFFGSWDVVCFSSHSVFVCAPSSTSSTSLLEFCFFLIPVDISYLSLHVTSLENPRPTLIRTNFLFLFFRNVPFFHNTILAVTFFLLVNR